MVFGSRFRGIPGGIAAFAGLVGPPVVIVTILAALYARYGEIDALRRILAGVSCAAVGLLLAVVLRMMMPLIRKRDLVGLADSGRGVRRHRPAAAAAAGGVAGRDPAQHRHHLCHAAAGGGMNSEANPIWTLAWTFGLMSLFAVGGANSAIPEMHRIAVDVHHWMTDKQFADVFAISQLSPGPNVLIVTLIGYYVAGVAGALAATLAMCGPTAVVAYYVSRLLARSTPVALAGHHPGGAGSAVDRADGRQRPDPGADLGPDLGRRPGYRRGRGAGLYHAAQSAVDVAGRRLFGFRWRCLRKIARQDRRTGIRPSKNRMGDKPVRGEEIDE